MYSDQKGVRTKTTPDKTFQTKDPRTKAPGQKPSRTIEREFVQRAFVRIFCTRPTKNRGGPKCVTYFWGVPGYVMKCGRGRGVKIVQKWRDVLYGRPLIAILSPCIGGDLAPSLGDGKILK